MKEENKEIKISAVSDTEEKLEQKPQMEQQLVQQEFSSEPEVTLDNDLNWESRGLLGETPETVKQQHYSEKKEKHRKLLSVKMWTALGVVLLALGAVVYYILFPSKGEFHADCTDTILWANASYTSGKILDPDFRYACLMPFGGNLLMLLFMPVFGLSMTTHILGMLLFMVLFCLSLCLLLRQMRWSWKWIGVTVAVLLSVLCASQKLREIFWGHVIYYSLGILFLFFGLYLLFQLQNLLQKQQRLRRIEANEKTVKIQITLTVTGILLFFLLCGTDQMIGITIFALPIMGALLAERILDRHRSLFSRNNCLVFVFVFLLGIMLLLGVLLGQALAGDLVGSYADAYSGYADQSAWIENLQKFPLAWLTLLGVENMPDVNLASMESAWNLIRIVTAWILLLIPVIATCCYPRYRGQYGKQMRILIWVHWTLTAIIMVGYICGLLSVANWRLSPILCTCVLVSMAFVYWVFHWCGAMRRITGLLCIPLTIFCIINVCQVFLMPPDLYRENVQYQLAEMLESRGLTYGYASFWNANSITVITDDHVKVRTVNINDTGVTPSLYQTNVHWYDDQFQQEQYFLLLTESEYTTLVAGNGEYLERAAESFSFVSGSNTVYQVLVYDDNLFN